MSLFKKIKKSIKGRFSFLLPSVLLPEYLVDFYRYSRHSGMIARKSRKNQIIGRIVQDYHVIEKGLTMPNSREGFGRERLLALINNSLLYIEVFGLNDEQLKHAVRVVNEYWIAHQHMRDKFGEVIPARLEKLLEVSGITEKSEQITTTSGEYFSKCGAEFKEFGPSRKSIRNYSNKDVPIELLEEAVRLAISSPSSCNKQGSRAHVYTDKEQIADILSIQTGNRGFGHLANKIFVVTGDLGVSHNVYERNQVYVDGGMFAMSLLYGLHSVGLVACPLNCYLPYSKERKLRNFCSIPDSEMLVMIISLGYPPDEFKIALSHRYSLEKILTVH